MPKTVTMKTHETSRINSSLLIRDVSCVFVVKFLSFVSCFKSSLIYLNANVPAAALVNEETSVCAMLMNGCG